MNTVFAIPELFERIAIAVEDKKTLAISAGTCQAFKDTMLNVLWADLDSVLPLVQLLKPLWFAQRSGWEFQSVDISPEDWDRFREYGDRVKTLKYISTLHYTISGSTYALDPSVFSVIGLSRPYDHRLLPNLHSLTLSIALPTCFINILPFIDGKIHSVALTFAQTLDLQSMSFVFSTLSQRLPFLRSIQLEDKRPVQDVEAPLVGFLGKLGSVTEVSLPRYYLTTQALEALSGHPNLGKISSYYNQPTPASEDRLVLDQMQLTGFKKLTKLAIAANLETLLPLMVETEWAPGLADIEVTSRSEATAWYLEKFCTTLTGSRRNIKSLHLDLFNPTATTSSTPLEFKGIEPLLGCRGITKFFMRHQYAIRMDLTDLERLLTEWTYLEEISICVDPCQSSQQEAGFPLAVLNTFGHIRPTVKHIGLYFDASIVPTWLPGLPRLDCLRVLHVGWSKPANPSEIGMFLASLCDSALEFKVGDSDISPSTNAGQTPSSAEWNEVTKSFRDFARMRERAIVEIASKVASKKGWTQMKRGTSYHATHATEKREDSPDSSYLHISPDL